MTMKVYDGEKATMSWTDDNGVRHEINGSLGHMPEGPWEFDESVTACFDDMLERSIPQYRVMREACNDVATAYATAGTKILDIGCSRGGALEELIKRQGPLNEYVGLEVSEPMLKAAKERFTDTGPGVRVVIQEHDLRQPFAFENVSVALSVLTLQFTPIEHRMRILSDVYQSLNPGGAFILVEKILGSTADLHGMMDSLYLNHKRRSGYSDEEIARKKLSLEGRLVSVSADWNEDALLKNGFGHVECFWRWMNFAAWVAVKV